MWSNQVFKMNFNIEDLNIANRLHELELRYPLGCLPQSVSIPTTDKSKCCLFEEIDCTIYKPEAKMVAFRTTHDRIQPWLKVLHLYYNMSCKDVRNVDFVDTPFKISPQHLLEKVTVDVKDVKTKKNFYKVTFFIKSGLIQIQGSSYNEFVSKDFPELLDIVHKICGPLELDVQEGNLIPVHQSTEETSPQTTTTNKPHRLSPNCMEAPQNRQDQPPLQTVLVSQS